MAGLLDFLNTDDARLGLGLLAAGGPSTVPMSVGQRVAGALQGMDADKQSKMKLQLLQSQIDENATQNQLRQAQVAQQAKRDAYYMGTGGLAGGSPMSAPGMSAAPGGAPMGGAPGAAPGPAGAGDRFSQWSSQYGIPRDALVNDYLTNGGKGIADMLMKRGTPDMQVSNGYAYDKNRLGAGFLPQLNTSQDGKSSMIRIGPDGLPVVSAPSGAVDTFSAYQGAQANFKPIKVFNPATQREEYTSEGAVVGGAQPPGGRVTPMAGPAGNVQSPGYSGGDRNSANAESIRIIQNEMMKPGNTPEDMAGMKREIQRLQMQSGTPVSAAPAQGGGYAAGPSAQEAAANAANQTRMVNTAAADVVRDTATQKKEKSAGEMIAATRRARELLQQGPTGSGMGEMIDKGASFFGSSTKGAEVAAKLDIVAGDLVNNVPRMEGPQSDGDRLEYKLQAGRAADRTLPPKIRLSAMDEVERLQTKYAKLNGGGQVGGAEGSWDKNGDAPKGKVVESLPTANASNKGQRIRDTATGKILVSNGMQWKEQ